MLKDSGMLLVCLGSVQFGGIGHFGTEKYV